MTEIHSTGRAFSRMVNRNLTLSHFCTLENVVYNMLTLFSLLRLIHMIRLEELEPRPIGSPPVLSQCTASLL